MKKAHRRLDNGWLVCEVGGFNREGQNLEQAWMRPPISINHKDQSIQAGFRRVFYVSRASVMWAARVVDSPPPDRGHDEPGCQCTSHGPTPRNVDQGPINPHEAPCSRLTGTPDRPKKTGRIVALARRSCAVHSGSVEIRHGGSSQPEAHIERHAPRPHRPMQRLVALLLASVSLASAFLLPTAPLSGA